MSPKFQMILIKIMSCSALPMLLNSEKMVSVKQQSSLHYGCQGRYMSDRSIDPEMSENLLKKSGNFVV